MIRPATLSASVLVALLGGLSSAYAQKATEQFIPLGKSPGLSYKYTSVGKIVTADSQARTVTVADAAGQRTVEVTNETRIWLDRSQVKRSSVPGSFGDLARGSNVEIKFKDPADMKVAEWVKVASPGS